jgi:hypothetical protein
VQKLNMRKETTVQSLTKYQHMMLRLAKAELAPNAIFHTNSFEYNADVYDLSWPAADIHDAKFFRPNEGLGEELIGQAKTRELNNQVELILDYGQLETQRVDVRNLIGSSGELKLEKYIITSKKQRLEYLLVTACLDSGQPVLSETARRLILVPGQTKPTEKTLLHSELLEQQLEAECGKYFTNAEKQSEQYYEEENEKLEHWSDDRKAALEIRMKQLDREVTEARRQARQLPSLKEKMDAKRALKKLERERDTTMLNYHEEKKKIEAKEDELLEEAAAALELKADRDILFTAILQAEIHCHLNFGGNGPWKRSTASLRHFCVGGNQEAMPLH